MKKITLILTFLALNLVLFAQAPRPFPAGLPTCLEDDFRELEKFYDAARGNFWATNWLTSPNMKNWRGIVLTSDSCDVKEINLKDVVMSGGTLVDVNLPKLEKLDLSFCTLKGNIVSFGNKPLLRELKLNYNDLSGQIPDFNLPSLEILNLENAVVTNGTLGNLPSLNNLPSLKYLNLAYNKLTGTIQDYSNMPFLEHLDFSNNILTGTIPNFSNLKNLEFIDFANNDLSGNIPNFNQIEKLKNLDLYSNNITGSIPNFTHLNKLELLNLSFNQLSGTVPNFNNLPKLVYLLATGNNLQGSVPNFNNLPQLTQLTLASNHLQGSIPDFNNLPLLESINLFNNNLSDTIPNFITSPKLKEIVLGSNQLVGGLPNFSHCISLIKLNVSKNKLNKELPILTQTPKSTFYVEVHDNFLNFGHLHKIVSSPIKSFNIYYATQKTRLPISFNNQQLIADLGGSSLYKLTYKWYRNFTLLSTIANNNILPFTKPGIYYYTVVDSTLKKLTLLSDTIKIGANLKGKVFFDENNNCNLDNIEKGKKEIIISFQSAQDTVTTVTDSLGNYEAALDTFNYSIVVKTGSLWKTCALPNIKFSSWSDSLTLNIPIQIKIACPENHVNLSTLRLRRCFNNTYTIKYSNKGTVPSTNTYIIVDFDQWLHVLSATKPYTQLAGNQYRFDIGILGVDEEGTINVTVKVDCDSTAIGQTHCSTAHIYPDSICATTSAWDMSSLQIKSKCELGKATFEVKNIGSLPTSQPRQSIVIEDQIMMLQTPINLGVGETKFYDFFPNGKTVRVQIEQANFHPSGNAFISSAIEGCGGTPTLGMITQFSQNDNETFVDTDCRQNIGAYDPNDKSASPRGYGEKSLIEPNTDIEYQINFQNEGTDTAFTVVLRDTIDQNLDLSTIQLVASSHPYSWTIEDRNTLKVTFNNIHLTTKKQSDSLSQGFLRYRISQKPNLASGIVIKNRAGIYFDFNKPIITNTTIHRIGRNFILVAVPDIKISGLDVKVFPNPFQNTTTFSINNTDNQSFDLKIIDNLGRVIYNEKANNGQIQFQNSLNKGIYFYQITQGNKRSSGKLMVQ